MRLDDVYPLWETWKSRQVKHSTLMAYRLTYRKHLSPHLGWLHMEDLDRGKVMNMMWLLLEKLSYKTCRDILAVLKMIIGFAGEELQQPSVLAGWRMPWPSANMAARYSAQCYTAAEVKRLKSFCSRNVNGKNAGILLSLLGGLRIGELCGLQWKDVDIGKRTLSIGQSFNEFYDADSKRCGAALTSPKTANSQRTVPLADALVPVLRKLRAGKKRSDFVLTGNGTAMRPSSMRGYYRRRVGALLDRRLTFHALRHTFASFMIEAGTDVKTLAAILGHSNVTTTMNLYVHPSDEAKKKALKKALKKLNF